MLNQIKNWNNWILLQKGCHKSRYVLSTLLRGSMQVSKNCPAAGFPLFCYIWNPIIDDSIVNSVNRMIATVSVSKFINKRFMLTLKFLFKGLRKELRHNCTAMKSQPKANFKNNWTNLIIEQLSNYISFVRGSSTRKKTLLTINMLPLN